MKRALVVLAVLSVLLSLVGQQVSASGHIVVEGGINRVEGFVPFSRDGVYTSTAKPYDVVVTVYRTIPQVPDVTIRIEGEASWVPWVSSGTGSAVWEYGTWHFWGILFPTDGKVEVGLRAPAPLETHRISVNVQDGFGASESRTAYVSPIGQPPTATPTPTSTPSPTATPTQTGVPPTATPTSIATPTTTPTPTAMPATIVMEGGVNTTEGFVAFNPTVSITVTSGFPVDIVVTVYSRGATEATVSIQGAPDWKAHASGTDMEPYYDHRQGVWWVSGQFVGTQPIELVVHTNIPPYKPSPGWSLDAFAHADGPSDWQVRHITIRNKYGRVFLPVIHK